MKATCLTFALILLLPVASAALTSTANEDIESVVGEAVVNLQNLKNRPTRSASLTSAQILKFEHEDWTAFRTVEGLQRKAGVPKQRLRRLVLKELCDNALDAGAEVRIGALPNGGY